MLRVDAPTTERFIEARRRRASMNREELVDELALDAKAVRRSIVAMIDAAQMGHIGGDLSVTDILVTLYGAVLSVAPDEPTSADRDRLILSKGHCAGALYSTLAQCGYFPTAALRTFMSPLSELNGHPNRTKVPGVETSTGPLGHGFPVAVGCALAAKLRGSASRTYVVLGDGELQEGSNWEAAMTAAHYELSSLTAIVDRNGLQQGASTEETKRLEPLTDKWRSFGFEVRSCEGHDYSALLQAFQPSTTGRPVCVIAKTIKGKGVSFIENRVEWHHKVPNRQQVHDALEELAQ